jgi:hypothetical protein
MRGRGSALALAVALVLTGCGGTVLQDDVAQQVAPTSSPPAASPSTEKPKPSPPPTRKPRARPQPLPSVAATALSVPPMRLKRLIGADAGWPQCPPGMGIPKKKSHGGPMPLEDSEYVILGVTNGPSFTPNPCLADQVQWVKERGMMIAAYAVHSFPSEQQLAQYGGKGPFDAGTELGRLANAGFQQTRYNLAVMERAGMVSPILWLDVEPVPDFDWSSDKRANAAVFQGAARGIRDAGLKVGAYSTPVLWDAVVGDFSLGGVPEWRAAGQTSKAEALRRCGDDWAFQGGPGIMGQWVQFDRDRNITCPGAPGTMADYFHRW